MVRNDPADILQRLSESYRTIKLARGVVGKTGQAMLGLLAIWAIVVWQLNENLYRDGSLIVAATMATIAFFWWTKMTQDYARANPAQALLEGAELLEYQKFEAQVKGLPVIANSPLLSDPDKPSPTPDDHSRGASDDV